MKSMFNSPTGIHKKVRGEMHGTGHRKRKKVKSKRCIADIKYVHTWYVRSVEYECTCAGYVIYDMPDMPVMIYV